MPRPTARPLAAAAVLALAAAALADPPAGPVVDSAMTRAAALAGLPPDCPAALRDRQTVVDVTYPGFDGKPHAGQVVVDRDLADDVRAVFAVMREHKFPVRSAVPAR